MQLMNSKLPPYLLRFDCEAKSPSLIFSLLSSSLTTPDVIKLQQTCEPVEIAVLVRNSGDFATPVTFSKFLPDRTCSIQTVRFFMLPEQVIVPPISEEKLIFHYYPMELETLTGTIELSVAGGAKIERIQYQLLVKTSRPKLCPSGLINVGQIVSENHTIITAFKVSSGGKMQLTVNVKSCEIKQHSVRSVRLFPPPQETSTDPTRSFNLEVIMERKHLNLTPKQVLELAELEVSIAPIQIFSIKGNIVKSPTWRLSVIGTTSCNLWRLPVTKTATCSWSDVTLLPSTWLLESLGNIMDLRRFAPLVCATVAMYVAAGSSIELPTGVGTEAWAQFMAFLGLRNSLSLDSFASAEKTDSSIPTLIRAIHSHSRKNQVLLESSLFFSEDFHEEYIRLQLLAASNLTSSAQWAYTMHEYVDILWYCYQNVNTEYGGVGMLRLLVDCFHGDNRMPQYLRELTQIIREMAMDQSQATLCLFELASKYCNNLKLLLGALSEEELKCLLLVLALPAEAAQDLLGLFRRDPEDLLKIFSSRFGFTELQKGLLQAVKRRSEKWRDVHQDFRVSLLRLLLAGHDELSNLLIQVSEKQTVFFTDMCLLIRVISGYDIAPLRDILWTRSSIDAIEHALLKLKDFRAVNSHVAAQDIYKLLHDPSLHQTNRQFNVISYILHRSSPTTWLTRKKRTELAWYLVCNCGLNEKATVSTVLMQLLELLPHKSAPWQTRITAPLGRLLSSPTSPDMLTLISLIESIENPSKSISKSIATLLKSQQEPLHERLIKLCPLLLTEELSSQNFSDATKFIASITWENREPQRILSHASHFFDDLTLRTRIQSVCFLLDLPSKLKACTVNSKEAFMLMNGIVPAWLSVCYARETFPRDTERLSNAISSLLTSFHLLIVFRGDALAQHLCTTSLSAALCVLTHSRWNERGEQPPTLALEPRSQLVESLWELIHQHCHQIKGQLHMSLTKLDAAEAAIVVDIVLQEEETPLSANLVVKLSATLAQKFSRPSDIRPKLILSSVASIIKNIGVCDEDAREWYENFVLLAIFLQPQQFAFRSGHEDILAEYTRAVVQEGLVLLTRFHVIRLALQETFSLEGMHFILYNISRLQQNLLTLNLGKCPLVKVALERIHVDLSTMVGGRCAKFEVSKSLKPTGEQQAKYSERKLKMVEQRIDAKFSDGAASEGESVRFQIPIYSPLNSKTTQDFLNTSLPTITAVDAIGLAQRRRFTSFNKSGSSSAIKTNANFSQIMEGVLPPNAQMEVPSWTGAVLGTSVDLPPNMVAAEGIKFTQTALREHLKNQFGSMYAKAGVMQTGDDSQLVPVQCREDELNVKLEHWTYSTLRSSSAILGSVDLVVEKLRGVCSALHMTNTPVNLCIVMDNSGSMSLHRNVLYEGLVILMEVLRKLEVKFAVATFGGRKRQKIVKKLNADFTDADGQFVLEAMTFDEGTYPATGLTRIVKKVFPPQTESSGQPHNSVLMITDGLTQERDEKSYANIILQNKLKFGVLFIEVSGKGDLNQLLLRSLRHMAKTSTVQEDQIRTEFPRRLLEVVSGLLGECVPREQPENVQIATQPVPVSIPAMVVNQEFKMDTKSNLVPIKNRVVFDVSTRDGRIPDMAKAQQYVAQYSKLSLHSESERAIEQLHQDIHNHADVTQFNNGWTVWTAEALQLKEAIEEVATTLEDVAFPLNRFSRRKAALRGSSLYMPGLLKAVSTEWSYKKIFSAKLAGGKRDHSVCLVLDVSPSMAGAFSEGLRASTVTLIEALRKFGMERFSVIVFGSSVRLVKTSEREWDKVTATLLLSQLTSGQDSASNDALALEAAVDLLNQVNTRGEKKIFILTDGYGCNGLHLPLVLNRAEREGIDVVAMAVGVDQTNLHARYKRFLHCGSVFGLPDAIKRLFTDAPISQRTPTESDSLLEHRKRFLAEHSAEVDLDTCYEDLATNKVFGEMLQRLAGEREFKLSMDQPSNISVDICFCLDVTSSMSRWLAEVKSQMRSIIRTVKQEITRKHPRLEVLLRFAVVAFRDLCDRVHQFQVLEFTEKEDNMIRFLAELEAKGGGDIPEDVLGALQTCLNLKTWSRSNARFIVLITDAPGHGRELNDDPQDKYPRGLGISVSEICDRLLKKDEEIDLMFCCIKPKATMKMKLAFEKEYQQRKKSSGKEFSVVKLFRDGEQEISRFHFVFVLDESGSMSGRPWSELVQAYQSFLETRSNYQGDGDIFSVIQFSTTARITCESRLLPKTPRNLDFHDGGTSHAAGLQAAQLVLSRDKSNSSIVMIFMSDGVDSNSQPLPILQGLYNQYCHRQFVCHTVAFGRNAVQSELISLQKMAQITGGKYHTAEDGMELTAAFLTIATECNVTGTLVDRFADILTQELSAKISEDFL